MSRGAQTLPLLSRPGPSAHHLQQWPRAFFDVSSFYISVVSAAPRTFPGESLTPAAIGAPGVGHELFAKSLQHQLILTRG